MNLLRMADAGIGTDSVPEPGVGILGSRLGIFETARAAGAVEAFLLSFTFVLALGADSGGYWPTAWDWTALVLLSVVRRDPHRALGRQHRRPRGRVSRSSARADPMGRGLGRLERVADAAAASEPADTRLRGGGVRRSPARRARLPTERCSAARGRRSRSSAATDC